MQNKHLLKGNSLTYPHCFFPYLLVVLPNLVMKKLFLEKLLAHAYSM